MKTTILASFAALLLVSLAGVSVYHWQAASSVKPVDAGTPEPMQVYAVEVE